MEAAEFWSTGDYAVVGDLWSRPGRDLAGTLPVEGRDVIDLATGTGVTAIEIARRGARSVTGVDVTPSLLQEAERRAMLADAEVRWLEADMADVPLPSASADLVTSTFGIVFAADPAVALAEARRLTRPGGRIVFTSWSANGLFGRIRQTLAPYFPDAPQPWHEKPADINTVAGPHADVVEETFDMAVPSPVKFIELLEQYSAPIILGSRALGDRWPQARAHLVSVVRDAGEYHANTFRVPVGYLVTTLHVV